MGVHRTWIDPEPAAGGLSLVDGTGATPGTCGRCCTQGRQRETECVSRPRVPRVTCRGWLSFHASGEGCQGLALNGQQVRARSSPNSRRAPALRPPRLRGLQTRQGHTEPDPHRASDAAQGQMRSHGSDRVGVLPVFCPAKSGRPDARMQEVCGRQDAANVVCLEVRSYATDYVRE